MDVWGPYKKTTHDKKYYFFTIVDDFSRATWIFLMQFKNKTIIFLKQFFCMVKNQFDASVKMLRTDNGKEVFTKQWSDFLLTHGVIHQSSCIYTLQQNGVVERKHRHILNTFRALKFQSNMPSIFWGKCVQTAIYIINRLSSSVLDGNCPFAMLYGREPSIAHVRVFGYMCYATNVVIEDKFAARAMRDVQIGY